MSELIISEVDDNLEYYLDNFFGGVNEGTNDNRQLLHG